MKFGELKVYDRFKFRADDTLIWTKMTPVKSHPQCKQQNAITRHPSGVGPYHQDCVSDDQEVIKVDD